jgi:hypothetical protein
MYPQHPGDPAVQLRVRPSAQQQNMRALSGPLRLVWLSHKSTPEWARQRYPYYRPSVRLCLRHEIACRNDPGGC